MAKAKKAARKSVSPKGKGKQIAKGKKKSAAKGPKKAPKDKQKMDEHLLCQYCDKPMKDQKTKKLHERSCRAKQEKKALKEKDKEFQSTLLKMKDEFEDQRQLLAEQFQKRENRMERELEEIRGVLRLEIDKHHRELEHAKKEVDIMPPAPEPIAVTQAAVEPDQPRAIDMIPTPLPEIPRKELDIPPVEAAPVQAVEPRDVPGEAIEPVPEEIIMQEGLEELVEEMFEKLSVKLKEELPEITSMPELTALGENLQQLSAEFSDLKRNNERTLSNITTAIEKSQARSDLKRLDRELGKVSDRLLDMMDETGFGEGLSVSKIPPTILEIVYQATIDDVMFELTRAVGIQDAESIARQALEEVRLKTSGSELFKFDGRRIVTDNLAKSITADLISAKQIQTTYDVLLERLLEQVPHHRAKNFRGMIKVKSQEFAVDRATTLTKDFKRLEKIIDSTSQMVAALSARFNSHNLEIQDQIKDIKDNLLAVKADNSELELLKGMLRDREEREAAILKDIGLLRAEMEMRKKIEVKTAKVDKKVVEKEIPKEDVQEVDNEGPVLEAVRGGAYSKTAITDKTGLKEKVVLETLSRLIDSKQVIEKKVGKQKRYLTPEQMLEEKVKAEEKKKAPVSKPKEEKAKAKPKKKTEDKEPPKKKPAKKTKEKKAAEKKEPAKAPDKKPEKKKVLEKKAPEEKKAPPKKKTEEIKAAEKKDEPKAEEKKEPEEKTETPEVKKTLDELSEDERKVLEVMTPDGLTISGIQSKVGKGLKYTAVLRALRVLIDSGHVGIITKGRLTLYQSISVKKMEKPEKGKNKQEVK